MVRVRKERVYIISASINIFSEDRENYLYNGNG